VRVQTWFPFTLQVYVNGHEWLARQMNSRTRTSRLKAVQCSAPRGARRRTE
jgi:hypothetical protein